MSIGPLMLDLDGCELSPEERELLAHPAVGGVILFNRNYQHPEQVRALIADIRACVRDECLIAVDQEGGRVQRFCTGMTRLPPAASYGAWYRKQPAAALAACTNSAWLLASELRAVDVDFSFAPVLDVDHGVSAVIGDRAFSSSAEEVAALGIAWLEGLRRAGMIGCGKHFPGHGAVVEDSHVACPVDPRDLAQLTASDLVPFARLIAAGLEAIMPAHVIYPQIDAAPAGFSSHWLKDHLRQRLGFQGAIFSDDLTMAAAEQGGDYAARAQAALTAGCDMVLVCNNRAAAIAVAETLVDNPQSAERLLRLRARGDVF